MSKSTSNEVNTPNEESWLLHVVAGCISGPVSRTLTAPVDRMKLQIQVHPTKQTVYEAWQFIMQNGGFLSLWRGNGVNVFKIAPEIAIKFALYDKIKESFDKEEHVKSLPLLKKFLSGAIAGFCGQTIIYPIETIKTRTMAQKHGEFMRVSDCIAHIYETGGWKGFYMGYYTSTIGVLINTGIDLAVYDTLRHYFLSSSKENEVLSAWKLSFCSCASIISAQCIAYPFYLIKLRVQARSQHASLRSFNGQCHLCKILKDILKEDGYRGFYRGFGPSLIKVLPAGVINYVLYEHAKSILKPFLV